MSRAPSDPPPTASRMDPSALAAQCASMARDAADGQATSTLDDSRYTEHRRYFIKDNGTGSATVRGAMRHDRGRRHGAGAADQRVPYNRERSRHRNPAIREAVPYSYPLKGQIETDAHRLKMRQKAIQYGKNTREYANYMKLVPKKKRGITHPRTPDRFEVMSKRSWDSKVKTWRKQLHEFEPREEGEKLTADTANMEEIDALLDDVEDPASTAHAVNDDEAALASLDAELAELEGDDMHSDNGGTSDKREFDELDEAALLDGDDDDDWDTL
eukprot:m.180892 g.180892  ORF g.180892 m.180892 type:complete len:272 (-) comp15128_c0_seq1:1760-2575(-)